MRRIKIAGAVLSILLAFGAAQPHQRSCGIAAEESRPSTSRNARRHKTTRQRNRGPEDWKSPSDDSDPGRSQEDDRAAIQPVSKGKAVVF